MENAWKNVQENVTYFQYITALALTFSDHFPVFPVNMSELFPVTKQDKGMVWMSVKREPIQRGEGCRSESGPVS